MLLSDSSFFQYLVRVISLPLASEVPAEELSHNPVEDLLGVMSHFSCEFGVLSASQSFIITCLVWGSLGVLHMEFGQPLGFEDLFFIKCGRFGATFSLSDLCTPFSCPSFWDPHNEYGVCSMVYTKSPAPPFTFLHSLSFLLLTLDYFTCPVFRFADSFCFLLNVLSNPFHEL